MSEFCTDQWTWQVSRLRVLARVGQLLDSNAMQQAPTDWFADEALWESLFSFMFPEHSYQEAEVQVAQVLMHTGLAQGAVLDLCCGPGRHAVSFAQRGFRVTGVDRTSFLLNKARTYAASHSATVEWILADMRAFTRPGAFDLAVNMFTSFGYFDDPEENLTVLRNVHTSLKPGGAFVLDLAGKEVIARKFQATGSQDMPGYGTLVQRRSVIDDWSRMEHEWLLIRDGSLRSFRFRHWMYSGRELIHLLAAVGFSDVRLFGTMEGAPYDPEAKRLIALARKESR